MKPLEPIIQTERLSHIYSAGTPFEHGALVDVDFTAYRGEYLVRKFIKKKNQRLKNVLN